MICRQCPAEVFFAQTAGGAKMPVDAEPNAAGNVAVVRIGEAYRARVLKKGEVPLENESRHHSHFTTCPSAAQFRRKK